MKSDPILEEIWKFRAAFAKRHGYDLRRMADAINAEAEVLAKKFGIKPLKTYKPRSTKPIKAKPSRRRAA
jgi:hypothetical protein